MKKQIKEKSAQYLKIVKWSDEDKCYVGTCPGLFFGGCHGQDEVAVYKELCEVVDEVIENMIKGKEKFPEPTAKEYSGKFLVRVKPEIHQRAVLAAAERHQSLNAFVGEALAEAVS